MEDGPRVRTRAEGAEEGRCEGEEGVGGLTYSQMSAINRRVDLPLFQMEEGILLSSFLVDGLLNYKDELLFGKQIASPPWGTRTRA